MLLSLNHLSKKYKRGEEGFYAVDHVNLEVKKGEFISIIGHSGSGKSTLLNMITGLLKPDEGSIRIDGESLLASNKHSMDLYRNRRIGYVMQGQNLLNNFTILDNLCLSHYLTKGKGDIRERAEEMLKLVGLAYTKETYPSQLSGGELRRISIARALILDPVLLIADEPTSNLDPENADKIRELFQAIHKAGTSLLVSTHDMEFMDYSNRIYRMEKGKLSSF